MDSFGRVLEIIVTVVLLFFFPLNYMAVKQNSICQTYVTTEVSYLVDSVRNIGYLTDSMYSTFIDKLAETNQLYEIELTHYKQTMIPISSEEVGIPTEEYENFYYGTYTDDILHTLFEVEESKGRYVFHQGDYFVIKVKNKNKTYATKLQEIVLNRELSQEEILVVYGGAIRDEIN